VLVLWEGVPASIMNMKELGGVHWLEKSGVLGHNSRKLRSHHFKNQTSSPQLDQPNSIITKTSKTWVTQQENARVRAMRTPGTFGRRE
jgi:hypothetical protein